MGRRERALDPAGGPVVRFAGELRQLRREAGGVTYRAMAQRAHFSAATLAQAAAGDRLPSLAVALAYAAACGGERGEWERRWRQAAREAAEEARADRGGDEAESPYLGPARFEVGDAERFFGRDALADRLVELLGRRHLVVVAGPSGSGKSSLLRAGLIPRLRRAAPRRDRPAVIRILTPGERPARTYADLLDPRRARPGTVLVVDQFEEVFTLCTDRAERTRFLGLLCAAAEPGHGIRVVLGLRDDFHGHLIRHRALAEAAREATLPVTPMSEAELREAVVRPAALGGLVVERALTARLVREAADEPGGLSLLSHALRETWYRRSGRVLTQAAYDAAGGLHGVVARTAEDLYRSLTDDQAEAARRILLRLVTPGQSSRDDRDGRDGRDTRRPADRTELVALGPGTAAEVQAVLERLAGARLVTLAGDTVELAHEAVLTAWPRLRAWIAADRERLRVQRQLTDSARTWRSLGRDPGSLYRGVRLALAERHCPAGRRDDLTPLEREFLAASLAARRRTHRVRRTRTAALSVLVVLSLVAALVAWQQIRAGEHRRIEAEARRVAGVADSLRTSDPQTAMHLSLAAWDLADLPETRAALTAAAAQHERDVFTDPDGGTRTVRRLSTDGRTLLSVGPLRVARWDLDTRRQVEDLPGPGLLPEVGRPRADAGWLPVFDPSSQVAVYDLADGRRDGPPLADADGGAEMGPGGRTLLVYDADGADRRIQLWDPHTRRQLLEIEDGGGTPGAYPQGWSRGHVQIPDRAHRTLTHDPSFPDATLSPDGSRLALCVPGERLQLWDVAEGRRLPAPRLPEVSVSTCLQERVRFSPDGGRLALFDGGGFRTWRISTGRELPAIEYPGLEDAEFSRDGAFVAASDGGEILVWRLAAPRYPVFRHRLSGETVKDLRLDADTATLRYLAGPYDGNGPTVHTLDLGRSVDRSWSGRQGEEARLSPDGAALAVARPDADGGHLRFRVLDVRTGELLAEPGRMPCPPPDTFCRALMAFDSTGRNLVYGVAPEGLPAFERGRIVRYDIARRRTTAVLDRDELGPGGLSNVAFGPDDRSLLLTNTYGPDLTETRVWDLRRRKVTGTIPHTAGTSVPHPGGHLVATARGRAYRLPSGELLPPARGTGPATALAFCRDGEYLAAGDASGRVVLWDGELRRQTGTLDAPETPARGGVSALACSRDGRTLAVAGDGGTLQLWDASSRRRIGSPLPTSGGAVTALAFSPGGGRLHAAGDRTPPQTYDIDPDRAARAVCHRVTGELSPREWQRHLPDTPYRETCPRGR